MFRMLYTKFQQLQSGQQVYYRYRWDNPPFNLKTELKPKVIATVIRQNNFTATISYSKTIKILYLFEKLELEYQEEVTIEATCSELFFTSDEDDWCEYKEFVLTLNPRGSKYSVNGFIGTHEVFNLEDFSINSPCSKTLEDSKQYIDSVLESETMVIPEEVILACRW